MRAAVYTNYGPPKVVQLKEVENPAPKDHEILVKVHATTVNRTDCGFRRPTPFIVRFFSGITKPKRPVLGSELAGEIEAVGRAVTLFNVGDRVFGLSSRFGAHAEYICLPEGGSVATMPATMTFEEAAAVSDGAMLALHCLRSARLQSGQRIVVYGASGSIGSAAVQLAKHFGAEVTGVCSTRHVELVRSLGADHVVDYTREDFTKNDQRYDLVFDAVAKRSFAGCRDSLKPGGIYMPTDLGFLAQNPLLALWTSRFGDKTVLFPLPRHSKGEIVFLRELIEAGEFRAVIDRRYPLERIVDAYRYVEEGHKAGNVVITLNQDATSPGLDQL